MSRAPPRVHSFRHPPRPIRFLFLTTHDPQSGPVRLPRSRSSWDRGHRCPRTVLVAPLSRACRGLEARAPRRPCSRKAVLSESRAPREPCSRDVAGAPSCALIPSPSSSDSIPVPDHARSPVRSGALAKVAVFLGSRASVPADGARSTALASLPRAGSPRSQEAVLPESRALGKPCSQGAVLSRCRGHPLVCTHSVTLLVRFDSCS